MHIAGHIRREIGTLPANDILSKRYAVHYSGVLLIDGKYVRVRGFRRKIPFIYCIDYETHDIPCGILAHAESEASFSDLLKLLEEIGYPLSCAVGDDSDALKRALSSRFPRALFQLCRTHYLENVRSVLRIRSDGTHHPFFASFVRVFERGHSRAARMRMLSALRDMSAEPIHTALIHDVYNRYDELFAHERFGGRAPHSNNLIEAFNSHLNGRLKTIKGFTSPETARGWLNAWMIRRRTKPFTDCERPFKHLNGVCSIEKTMRSGTTLKEIFRFLNIRF